MAKRRRSQCLHRQRGPAVLTRAHVCLTLRAVQGEMEEIFHLNEH